LDLDPGQYPTKKSEEEELRLIENFVQKVNQVKEQINNLQK
jgi:hypothetical protein